MSISDIKDQKKNLRAELRRQRNRLPKEMRIAAEAKMLAHGLKVFNAISNKTGRNLVLGGYWPLAGEADPRMVMQDMERRSYDLALPVMTGPNEPLIYRQYSLGDPLSESTFGVMEPDTEAPQIIPDIILVPLLGFDANCYRLGHGGGFYDRTIAKYPHLKTFGWAYAAQVVDKVPTEAHDIPLQAVITEVGLSLPPKSH